MAFRDIVDRNIRIGGKIDEAKPGDKPLEERTNGKGGGNFQDISHVLAAPTIKRHTWIVNTPVYESSNPIMGPTIGGNIDTRKLKLNPQIGTINTSHPYVPIDTSFLDRIDKSFQIFHNHYNYLNGPLDFALINLTVNHTSWKNTQNRLDNKTYHRYYAQWVAGIKRYEYFDNRDYNYTLDNTTDLQTYIRLLKMHALAGVRLDNEAFWTHHLLGLTDLAYWHFLKIIHTGTWVARWEDLPSLTSVNDVQLNKLLKQPDKWLDGPANYDIIDLTEKNESSTTYFQTHYKQDDDLHYVDPPKKYSVGNLPRYHQYFGDKQYRLYHPYLGTNPSDVLTNEGAYDTNQRLYFPEMYKALAKKAMQRARDLLLASLQKTVAIQTAIEDEDVHTQHEDYTDGYENPFLIFNPSMSRASGVPTFTDVSLRPGKHDMSYTSKRYSLETWEKMPETMKRMYRFTDASGRSVPGGANNDDKPSFLPLIALGAAGFYIYTQVKGG